MNLQGFARIEEREIPEIGGRGVLYRHTRSGLRVLHLDCADENKVFMIGFTTPPEDDTGVAHILEHSVLGGSEKYPVKEPFAELIKGSLNTFLNAFTAGDCTMYPCASCNEQDFLNLTEVYLDAVFHPAIHHTDEIFMQEGWHYELDDNGVLSINGVVYNEMKGAMSAPVQIGWKEINRALHDNCYGRNSGGDPAAIPALTNERFTAFHRRYYSPSNALVTLYGNMELSRVLGLIERAVPKDADPDAGAVRLAPSAPLAAPAVEEKTYPVNEDAALAGKAYLFAGYAFMLPGDARRAMEVLTDALFNVEAAPVRRALLQSGLCGSVSAYLDTTLVRPTLYITCGNADAGNLPQLQTLLTDTLAALGRDGVIARC